MTSDLRARVCSVAISCIFAAPLVTAAERANAGPMDVALNPSPQATDFSCQSYSFALAMAFNPASPFKADTTGELRDLERSIRSKIEASAKAHGRSPTEALRSDWPAAVKQASNNVLVIKPHDFASVDAAMRFVAASTGISAPVELGTSFSIALVKTPVIMSFRRIRGSNYGGSNGNGSHIATVFGVELPMATMSDQAKPKLLIVNSAVKYGPTRKNVCWDGDLSDNDHYRAEVTLTNDYELKKFAGEKPFPIDTLGTAP